jgi:hypothetical protein
MESAIQSWVPTRKAVKGAIVLIVTGADSFKEIAAHAFNSVAIGVLEMEAAQIHNIMATCCPLAKSLLTLARCAPRMFSGKRTQSVLDDHHNRTAQSHMLICCRVNHSQSVSHTTSISLAASDYFR